MNTRNVTCNLTRWNSGCNDIYKTDRFEKSLKKKSLIFHKYLKIARTTPIFKGRDSSNVSNCRSISVLPWFSKFLERIMHNRLYRNLNTKELLHLKQFGFSSKHSTVKLVDQIYKSFEKKSKYTRGFPRFIKRFWYCKKIEVYGIKGINLAWFCGRITVLIECMNSFTKIIWCLMQGNVISCFSGITQKTKHFYSMTSSWKIATSKILLV